MAEPRVFPLESIRTDGWFQRIGEGIGSFQALCDIVGPRFFAFAMITGARITALTVDRRQPDNTLVDFVVGGADSEIIDDDVQRLTLIDFRRRLVLALLADEPTGPPPGRVTDTETLQLYIGVRFLLLAPLYGYGLSELRLDGEEAQLDVIHDGLEQTMALVEFRAQLREHVREELDRVPELCRYAPAQGAFYLMLEPDTELDAVTLVERLIREHRIAVIPGTAFGIHDRCTARLSYGALDEPTAREAATRLATGLRALRK